MILPNDAVISEKKIRDYLLVKQSRNDKSLFLESAGYTRLNWEQLSEDIRLQLLPNDAVLQEQTSYGDMFSISGLLQGPNGKQLSVKSIWVMDRSSGIYRFVTLIPERKSKR